MRIKTYSPFFCKSSITKDSHGDTGIGEKNRVLKQAKMVSIYQKNNTTDTKKIPAINNSDSPYMKILTILSTSGQKKTILTIISTKSNYTITKSIFLQKNTL